MTMTSTCALEMTVQTVTIESVNRNLGSNNLKITIRHLRAQNNGAEISVGVLLENGEHCEQKNMIVTTEQYTEWKLCRGEISEETYELLEDATLLCKAMRNGEHLLAYGANTKQMLARKLTQKGYSREISERAAERLCEMGLLNEDNDLRREVEKCLRKLWGEKRIVSHLWNRGFSADTMTSLPMLLEEVDFALNCKMLIRKHYGGVPSDINEQRRMIAGLSRYGYSLGEIKNAIRQVLEEES